MDKDERESRLKDIANAAVRYLGCCDLLSTEILVRETGLVPAQRRCVDALNALREAVSKAHADGVTLGG